MAYTMPLLVCGFVLLPLSQKFGKRTIMLSGVGIQMIGCILIILIPKSMPVILAATVMKSIGQSCAATMYQPMLADSIEYGHWKTGIRSQAALMGANGAGQKVGQGLVTALLGGIMSIAGFSGMAAVQSEKAIGSVSGLFLFVPLVFTIIEFAIIYIYDLDKKYDTIMKELEERKGQEA